MTWQRKGAYPDFSFHESLGKFGQVWKVFPAQHLGWPLKLCVLFSQWAAGPDPAAGLPALRGLRHLLQLLLLGLHCEDHHGVRWRRRSSCWMPGEHRLRVSEVSPQLPLLSASHPLPFPHLLFHTYSHPYIETQLSSLVSGWELFCAGKSVFQESQSWKEP